MNCSLDRADESGAALLLTLLALTLLSLLGFFLSFSATTGVKISDNYESQVQATYASLAGLSHARALVRGLSFDGILNGPDGIHDTSIVYMSGARGFEFRNPLPLMTALRVEITDPLPYLSGIPDDGWINTGFCNGVGGVPLIPGTGILQEAPNPYGPGLLPISRYFVKVSDNNGEASEVAGDAADSPFFDGDGTVIVRSLGIAKTIPSAVAGIPRRNSVAIFEARLKRYSTWALGPALVLTGPQSSAQFSGGFEISGGPSPGIGTIDTIPSDDVFPDLAIRVAAGTGEGITGGNDPVPSVRDITMQVSSNADQCLLLNPGYLWDFVRNRAPQMADSFHEGNQSWVGGAAPYLGSYDASKPWNSKGQDPRITVVHGDLEMSGDISGGGLLVVTGSLSYSGSFAFSGLVIVAGSGQLNAAGAGTGIEGGVVVANLIGAGDSIAFGSSGISIGATSRIVSNTESVRMAIGLMPASQISFREIASSDP